MEIFDECIAKIERLTAGDRRERFGLGADGVSWPDAGKNQLIFLDDLAYELGGGKCHALGGTLFTDDRLLVPEDEIFLIGPDLGFIREDSPYARVSLIRVNDKAFSSEKDLYGSLQKIDYTRYHLNPEGFMMRISSINRRESVRVGRSALKKGISFSDVGRLFIGAYHGHPAVEAVRIFFITDPAFPYAELEDILKESEKISKALDHIFSNALTDCSSCNLKKICASIRTQTQKSLK